MFFQLVQEILTVLHDVERSDSRGGGAAGTSDLRGHMSAQTVFSVLDHCTQWRQHRITRLVHAATTQNKGKPLAGKNRSQVNKPLTGKPL